MKQITFVLLLLFSMAGIAQVKSTDILGVWRTENGDAKVEIYKNGQYFHGRVVWIEEPNDEDGSPVKDKYNPDESLKDRPVLGIDILAGFSFDEDEWSGGYIYDPKDGETYTCKLWLEKDNLKVRGYLGFLFDTKTWTPVS